MTMFRRASYALALTVVPAVGFASPHTDKQRGPIASFIPHVLPQQQAVEPVLQPEQAAEPAVKKSPEERFGMTLVNDDGQGDFIVRGNHFLTKCMEDSARQKFQFVAHVQYSFNLSNALNSGVSDEAREDVLHRVISQTRDALEKAHKANPTPSLVSPEYLDGLTKTWKLNTAAAHASNFTNALDAAAGMAVDVQINNQVVTTGLCNPVPNLQTFKQIEAVYQYHWARYMQMQQLEHRVNMR